VEWPAHYPHRFSWEASLAEAVEVVGGLEAVIAAIRSKLLPAWVVHWNKRTEIDPATSTILAVDVAASRAVLHHVVETLPFRRREDWHSPSPGAVIVVDRRRLRELVPEAEPAAPPETAKRTSSIKIPDSEVSAWLEQLKAANGGRLPNQKDTEAAAKKHFKERYPGREALRRLAPKRRRGRPRQ
jgi:hypothetical protein